MTRDLGRRYRAIWSTCGDSRSGAAVVALWSADWCGGSAVESVVYDVADSARQCVRDAVDAERLGGLPEVDSEVLGECASLAEEPFGVLGESRGIKGTLQSVSAK